jgi:hypothetical protein
MLEQVLLKHNNTFTGQSLVRWPERLIGKISHLTSTTQTADFKPTSQQRAVNDLLKEHLSDAKRSFREFMDTEMNKLSLLLNSQGAGLIVKP